jgi:AcrR family transcriptional regulator
VSPKTAAARTQAQRSAATRAAIVTAATRLFAARGFDATGIEDIASEAGVSKGALYHHYADKVEVLAAVYEHVEEGLTKRLLAAAGSKPDPLDALRVGCQTFLDACLDPVIRRIALVEAPVGLGWQRWRAIDARYGFGLLLGGLRAAAESGQVSDEDLDERAQLLLAALIEASLLIGASSKPRAARRTVGRVVDQFIDALALRPTRA